MGAADREDVERRLAYAELALKNGDPATALATADEVLETPRDVLTVGLSLRARSLVASAREGTGDYSGALAELDLLVSEVPRDLSWVGLLMTRNRCRRESGDVQGALRYGHAALAEVEQEGLIDTEEGIRLAVTIAGAHTAAGDLRHALRLCEVAAERAEAIGSGLGRASAYWNASGCHYRLGDMASSARFARAALSGFEEAQDPRSQGMLHSTLALISLRLDPPDPGAAEIHLSRAEELMEWSEASAVEKAQLAHPAAMLARSRGDLAAARRVAEAGIRHAEGRSPSLTASFCIDLGGVALDEGRLHEAKEQFGRAVLLLSSCGQDMDVAQTWFELGGLLDALGDGPAAIDAYRRAAVSTGLVEPGPTPAPA